MINSKKVNSNHLFFIVNTHIVEKIMKNKNLHYKGLVTRGNQRGNYEFWRSKGEISVDMWEKIKPKWKHLSSPRRNVLLTLICWRVHLIKCLCTGPTTSEP